MKNFIRIIFILVLITSSFSLNAQTNSNYRKYKFGIVAELILYIMRILKVENIASLMNKQNGILDYRFSTNGVG